MIKKTPDKGFDSSLLPVEENVKNLLVMFEFFLTERHFKKSIEDLGESVKDMRIIIGRILVDHFMNLPAEEEAKFCTALASMLADRVAAIPTENNDDQEYYDYCIGEILTGFEYAQEVKEAYPDDAILQKILALDIPILRPFDYGLRGKFSIVHAKKKQNTYQ